jgi:hypothetical protein
MQFLAVCIVPDPAPPSFAKERLMPVARFRDLRTTAVCGFLALSLITPVHAQAGREWEPGGRGRAYVNSLVGPGALMGLGLATAIDQARDDPPQWGNSWEKRLASNAGRNAVQETVRHGIAAVLDRSVSYRRCSCAGIGSRIGNAVVEVVTDRDRNGGRSFGIARFAGSYAGAYAESTWRPDRDAPEILAVGTSILLFGTASNLWREFVGWPR